MHLSWLKTQSSLLALASSAKLSNDDAQSRSHALRSFGLNESDRVSKTNVDESHLSKAGTNADRSANQEQRESKGAQPPPAIAVRPLSNLVSLGKHPLKRESYRVISIANNTYITAIATHCGKLFF